MVSTTFKAEILRQEDGDPVSQLRKGHSCEIEAGLTQRLDRLPFSKPSMQFPTFSFQATFG
jgi:hypothetical protein